MYTSPLEFLESCLRYIHELPPSERWDKALWLLDQIKTGPVGRYMLGEMQRENFLRFLEGRLGVRGRR